MKLISWIFYTPAMVIVGIGLGEWQLHENPNPIKMAGLSLIAIVLKHIGDIWR